MLGRRQVVRDPRKLRSVHLYEVSVGCHLWYSNLFLVLVLCDMQAYLHKADVKVFQQASRRDSMIIRLLMDDEDPVSDLHYVVLERATIALY